MANTILLFLQDVLAKSLPQKLRSNRISTAIVSVIGAYMVIRQIVYFSKKRKSNQKCLAKRKRCAEDVEQMRKNLQGKKTDSSLIKLNTHDLLKKLRDGDVTALDVLHAFQAKALDIHTKTNCLVEPVKEAEACAAEFDGLSVKPSGMLAGLPISIKENVPLKGYDCTLGVVALADKPAAQDYSILQILKKHGAIPFVRTGTPQLLLSYEGETNLYGKVVNPHDSTRISGGSSSGEGSLIGGGGSVLGIGSDTGGSIRVPCHFSGLCGFKPTTERMIFVGAPRIFENSGTLKSTWGPMARDVDSLSLVMKALWDGSMIELDPYYSPLTFDEQVLESKGPLRIAYFYDSGGIAPTPTARRAVDMAKNELQKKGHELIEWCPPDMECTTELESRLLLEEGGYQYMRLLVGEKFLPCIEALLGTLRRPWAIRWLLSKVLKPIDPESAAKYEWSLGVSSAVESWRLRDRVMMFQNRVAEEWKEKKIDAVISPPLPFPAVKFGQSNLAWAAGAYQFIYNVLNFPAGIVRMTKVKAADLDLMADYPIRDH